jgi:hypothetical protein
VNRYLVERMLSVAGVPLAALALLLAGPLWAPAARAQANSPPAAGSRPTQAAPTVRPAPAAKSAPTLAKPAGAPSRYLPNRFAAKAGRYYKLVWGIEALSVKWAESGEMIRFSWRVVDPERAAVLNDKKIEPSLNDPKAGVSLVVPVLDKIGQMRQSAPPEAGQSYWMAFSNKGRVVKRGDRVDVVIGPFRAENLAVD